MNDKSVAQQHPTGLAALATTLIVWIVKEAGVDMPPEVAAAAVGLVAAAVSYFTPRRA